MAWADGSMAWGGRRLVSLLFHTLDARKKILAVKRWACQ